MNFLLPNKFKRIGLIMAPLGFFFWATMQLGYLNNILEIYLGINSQNNYSNIFHLVNILVATIAFFSFLFGVYFITFSKEKIEDEMIEKVRLNSFQFAAIFQLIFIILGFIFMVIIKEPSPSGMLLFVISALFLFWVIFIVRFNYIIGIKLN